ncbi:MAG: hypothetical protein AAFQ82_00100 [Myxococcota bacterium]
MEGVQRTAAPLGSPPPVMDGQHALRAAIARASVRDERGLMGTVVWDIDHTLFDPAPRMAATVRAFGASVQDSALDSHSWEKTADRHGLAREKFGAFWDDYYWRDATILKDAPIGVTVNAALEAQRAGIHNAIVTGRFRTLAPVSRRQLAGVGIRPDVLLTKTQGQKTPESKAQHFLALLNSGARIEAFVTDRMDEIEAVRSALLPQGIRPTYIWVVPQAQTELTLPPDIQPLVAFS